MDTSTSVTTRGPRTPGEERAPDSSPLRQWQLQASAAGRRIKHCWASVGPEYFHIDCSEGRESRAELCSSSTASSLDSRDLPLLQQKF
mmetsp:Transcript_44472/g.96748  ORF Transcript_44472/g.96748 Transcript_44472/m.96748 type:complete len:88 (-) Transcript_44472:67-330(-)